ncbi:hypothetical protein BJ508DRAFT_29223 [Ascobolus immersus RN42]|uniref:Uncharacterized protein n=1 Tax=Ascobolus immersus RN42 TaxID=1160509 RepID=A0A3N4HSQ1_ASCIM|nr:hypothetical protein BJ508DRAFT_29223 [Ascobolus immersus RN42]
MYICRAEYYDRFDSHPDLCESDSNSKVPKPAPDHTIIIPDSDDHEAEYHEETVLVSSKTRYEALCYYGRSEHYGTFKCYMQFTIRPSRPSP